MQRFFYVLVLLITWPDLSEAQSMVADTLQAEWVSQSGATASSTPPPYPVIFVHGLNSSDLTWQATIQQLQSEGWGDPYSYHFDLNATYSTYYVDDVPAVRVRSFWEFANPRPGADSTIHGDSGARPAGSNSSHLFVANFRNTYDAAGDVMYVHGDWNISGESNSNCAAIAKQAYALSGIVGDVLYWTGSDRVILMGHSMGGLAIREYLQRRQPGGAPMWWVDPADTQAGHHVAGVVTTGTPHQGSNTVDLGIIGCPDSEATRDLRYTYLSTGEIGRYLYGGSETVQAYWHNDDVNADGDVSDTIDGLNGGNPYDMRSGDNPLHPLPRNIQYRYIYSSVDGVVATGRQYPVWTAPDNTDYFAPYGVAVGISRDRFHLDQTSDVEVIRAALMAVPPVSGEAGPSGVQALHVTAFPNPTRGLLAVSFVLDRQARVGASIVDVLGRAVLTLAPQPFAPGPQSVQLDASSLPAGVYVLSADVDGISQLGQRITVLR